MIESQRWFQITIAAISLVVAIACWMILRPELAHLSARASIAAFVLYFAAGPRLYQLLRLFLPIALAKAFPQLDRRQ